MLIKRILNNSKKKKTKKSFQLNSFVNEDLVLLPGASCRNDGSKEDITIGRHCTIGASFFALFGGKISVGENTYIGQGTSIQSKEKVTIGNNVIIANNVVILDNNNHPTSAVQRMQMSMCDDYIHDELWSWKYADSAPITIEENTWIGRDVRILKGVTVGKGSIVALGAIVTKDVPPYSIVAGNPARVVKKLEAPQGDANEKN